MTALHLLALAGYFLILFEFIAMRHRDICAESNEIINRANSRRIGFACFRELSEWNEALEAQELYWNRGTK